MNIGMLYHTGVNFQFINDTLVDKKDSGMVLTFIRMQALTEKRKELRQTLQSLNTQIKAEAGCLDSNLYQSDEDENHFLLIESWENRNALDAYLQSIRFTVLLGARSLLSRPPQITIHTVSQSSELQTVL